LALALFYSPIKNNLSLAFFPLSLSLYMRKKRGGEEEEEEQLCFLLTHLL
jgi:uncharacterized membrane protein